MSQNKYKILVVEDEKDLNAVVTKRLTAEGFSVDSCFDGEEALDYVMMTEYDAIVLDVMMPKKDGLMVCREIRRESNVPIIMLTAKAEEFDKLLGLELGADDYITKPFNILEVKARIKAIIRRTAPKPKEAEKIIQDFLSFQDTKYGAVRLIHI